MHVKEYIAAGLIALILLGPLTAAVLNSDNADLQQKARTDMIQSDPTRPPAGAPATPGGPPRQ